MNRNQYHFRVAKLISEIQHNAILVNVFTDAMVEINNSHNVGMFGVVVANDKKLMQYQFRSNLPDGLTKQEFYYTGWVLDQEELPSIIKKLESINTQILNLLEGVEENAS